MSFPIFVIILKNTKLGKNNTKYDIKYIYIKIWLQICDPGHKPSVKSLGYICSNSQKYIVWVKIIDFSFMPKISRILTKDRVTWRYLVNDSVVNVKT